MTSRLQEPCHAGEQAPRRFVAFMFRLHSHPQADRVGDMRRLDRKVMCEREERGLDGVEPGMRGVGFVRHGRRSVVRCELSFDDEARNDTQEVPGTVARSCVTQITGGAPDMAGIPLQTLVLRRLASVKHKAVAEALGTDESTVSRIASGERGCSPARRCASMWKRASDVREVCGERQTQKGPRHRGGNPSAGLRKTRK